MKLASKFLIRLAIGTAVMISMLAFQGMHSTAVHAASSCYADTCNDKDPTTTVGPHGIFCNKDAFLQEHKDYSFGWIENWWSHECNANWTIANVNSGDYIGEAEVNACGGTPGFNSVGNWTCSVPATQVCDYLPNGVGWDLCFLSPYDAGDIPAGATHWYTNMVRGDQPTISYIDVGGNDFDRMQTGWH